MNKKWCSHCSHPNPYESIAPRICAKCGKDMLAAFAPTASTQPTQIPTHQRVTASTPPPVDTSLRRPQPLYGSYEEQDSGRRYSEDSDRREVRRDSDEVQARAMDWQHRLEGITLSGGFSDGSHKTSVKLGDIENFRNAANASDKATTKKRGGKRKS